MKFSREQKKDLLDSISFWSDKSGKSDVKVLEVTNKYVKVEFLTDDTEATYTPQYFLDNYEPDI